MSIPVAGTVRKIRFGSDTDTVPLYEDLDDPEYSDVFDVPQGDPVLLMEVTPMNFQEFRVKVLTKSGKVGWTVALFPSRDWDACFE